jgi:hypothetical protein
MRAFIRTTLITCGALALCSLALAQTDDAITNAERSHAAMMILVLMLIGVLATFGLLVALRRKGLLKDATADDPLGHIKDQIAQRSDEIER